MIKKMAAAGAACFILSLSLCAAERDAITGNVISLADLQEAVFALLTDTRDTDIRVDELSKRVEVLEQGGAVAKPNDGKDAKAAKEIQDYIAQKKAGDNPDISTLGEDEAMKSGNGKTGEYTSDDYDRYIIAYNNKNVAVLNAAMSGKQ